MHVTTLANKPKALLLGVLLLFVVFATGCDLRTSAIPPDSTILT